MLATGTTQENGWPNRRTPETGTEKTTNMTKSYQREERGQKVEQQKRDKKLTRTGEQEASHPIHLALCYARTLGTFLSALWRLDCLLYGYGIVRMRVAIPGTL